MQPEKGKQRKKKKKNREAQNKVDSVKSDALNEFALSSQIKDFGDRDTLVHFMASIDNLILLHKDGW